VPFIHSKGSMTSPVWILVDTPYAGDIAKGYLFSSGYGYVFEKMMQDAGFTDYYVTCYRPDTDARNAYRNIDGELNQLKPPIIIPLGAVGQQLLPEMRLTSRKANYNPDKDSAISKYAGSIMTSDRLTYPHYVIPTFTPEDITKQWKQRDVVVSCDLSKAYAELEYWKQHRVLNPLPVIDAKVDFPDLDELLYILKEMMHEEWISNDIETIYPRKPTKTQPSQFYKILPGYPITIGLASTNTSGISFELFRENNLESVELWKCLAKLLKNVRSVGQNFFNFDANFYEMLGFELPLAECRDTMILHHQLWPELQHKLQFLARQYTRHPYWKDEGAGWTIKNMRGMKIYNVKDVCVTLEIFKCQLEELKQRGLG
jgi:uracil-DNA glycosylase